MQSVVALLHRLEDALLAFILAAMIVLAALQIVMRNWFDSAIFWIDPLLQVSVLWLGLLGAAAATRVGRHVTIDVLEPLLKPAIKQAVARFAHAMAALITAVVAWHAGRFVWMEYQWPTEGVLGLPTWLLQLVIPFSFSLMSLRFGLQVIWPPSSNLQQKETD